MPKALKYVLIFIGLLIIIIVAQSIKSTSDENATKKLLAKELTTLPVPAGCQIGRTTYQPGNSDAQSSWNASYNCHTTGGTAYAAIIAGLHSQGFTVNRDSSLSYPGDHAVSYYFSYASNKFFVQYNFLPQATYLTNQLSALQTSNVNGISLILYKENDSPIHP